MDQNELLYYFLLCPAVPFLARVIEVVRSQCSDGMVCVYICVCECECACERAYEKAGSIFEMENTLLFFSPPEA